MVLTVSFVLAPETGLCCLRRQRDAKHHRQLDISVGTSGPHDFAVRLTLRSSGAAKTSTASRPTLVTIGQTPLLKKRDVFIDTAASTCSRSKLFLRAGLD